MIQITYGFHDKRGGREARLNRALNQADAKYPDAKSIEATFTDDPLAGKQDDKAVIRVEVTIPEGLGVFGDRCECGKELGH